MGAEILQLFLFFAVLIGLAKPLGTYMANVLEGRTRFLEPVERLLYRLCGIDPEEDMGWKTYAFCMLAFQLIGVVIVYLIQRTQAHLPLNPDAMAAVPPLVAFNTAISFVTNTNWQTYGGEFTMSYLTQMLALTTQNFVSAAAGIAMLAALARGFARQSTTGIGNFWADMTRTNLYILLPLSALLAIILVVQGTPQTFNGASHTALMQALTDGDGKPVTEQTIAVGPAASQIAIKQLGTNGGGFYNMNSAHPFENPTPLTNFLECLYILLISAALCYTFGKMVGDTRQGWAILAAMTLILWGFLAVCCWSEMQGSARLASMGVDVSAGNMEGKEVRIGTINSALWCVCTTAASNGSVNSMHDSYNPLGGGCALLLMKLGEVVFGGVGSGLYGMLVFAVVAVFTAGLMVGRTPEYLGKKIEAYDMKMCSLVILLMPAAVLGFTAWATLDPATSGALNNNGPHGFSEILYAFTSQGNNNGSAFAGLTATGPLFAVGGAAAMVIGRYWLCIPMLALAGSLAAKKKVPPGQGTLPTHTPLFVCWLIMVVMIVGALVSLPALALGPIVEHFLLPTGALY
jgi:K+-transporting ATPase ATPase A chain